MSLDVHHVGLDGALNAIAACETLADLSDHALAPFVSAFEANSMVAFRQRMDGQAHQLKPVAAINQARAVLNHYLEKVSPLDPCMPYWRARAIEPSSIWRYSDVCQDSKIRSSARFRQFLSKRANVGHMMMISFNLHRSAEDSLLIALHRAPGLPDFGESEWAAAQNIAPVLRQMLRGLASAETWMPTDLMAQSLLGSDGLATQILVDAQLHVICGDTAGKDALQRLSASSRLKLRSAVKTALGSLEHGPKQGTLNLGTYGAHEVSALPLDSAGDRFVLKLTPTSTGEHVFAPLTPRQREVAELVASGCRNWQVAELLRISENTVVNHLAAIYDTLAIGGRIELALLWKEHGAKPMH